MKNVLRVILSSAFCVAAVVICSSCGRPFSVTLVPAPPGPADLGPATGLSTPPPDAVVFDLKYLPQTGAADDIVYHSFWGYGGSADEAKLNPFLQEVRKRASGLYPVQTPSFPGREWAAVEYRGRQALALYFDLDADGKLGANERIEPTRKTDRGVEFITPDFMQRAKPEDEFLCRALLQVNFWSSEPNCMWSPAAVMESTNTFNGQAARLLLYANNPGGAFNRCGSSAYSLLLGGQIKPMLGQYVPREALSSLISSEGKFYHLTVEGRRSNGLPARAVLVKDTTPTGALMVKLTGSNSLQAKFASLYLHGVYDKTVFLRVGASKDRLALPVGTYELASGAASYGASGPNEWEVSFTKGPQATVKEADTFEVSLGQPTVTVRAVDERNRYDPQAAASSTFKKGTRIYLEPKVFGKGQELFGRFQQTAAGKADKVDKVDRPPKVTITGPDGKELLSKVMEYG